MNLKIISWNVRGLNCSRKRGIVRNIIRSWKADIVCLQETKLRGDITNIIKEVWGSRWVDFVQLEASGTRGGVVIMWDKRNWEGVESNVGMYSDTCRFIGKSQNLNWHLTGVYAPNGTVERENTWSELGAARGLCSGP